MILDTSAIIAILRQEPEAPAFAEAIEQAGKVGLSVANALEASIVVGREGQADLTALLEVIDPELIPVDADHLAAARHAWLHYGRGSGSSARLNYGDCWSYAAAKLARRPLLFKGDDFVHTDIESAL